MNPNFMTPYALAFTVYRIVSVLIFIRLIDLVFDYFTATSGIVRSNLPFGLVEDLLLAALFYLVAPVLAKITTWQFRK
jgi:hypothetical protein